MGLVDYVELKVGILSRGLGGMVCKSACLQYLHGGYDAHASATSLAATFRCVLPLGKAHSCLALYIVEGSPVVRPGIPGPVVTIEAPNARIAAIVRIAESKKTTKAGA